MCAACLEQIVPQGQQHQLHVAVDVQFLLDQRVVVGDRLGAQIENLAMSAAGRPATSRRNTSNSRALSAWTGL